MKKILIIDDDRQLCDMYQHKFVDAGYGVMVAHDGKLGLVNAFETKPDLILLDVSMPYIDGMTVLRRIREDSWGKKVPVIMLSNLDATGDILEGVVETKPSYYILKVDSTPEEVLQKIKEIL